MSVMIAFFLILGVIIIHEGAHAVGAINLAPIPALDGGQILVGAICSLWGNSPQIIRFAKGITLVFFLLLLAGLLILMVRDVLLLF